MALIDELKEWRTATSAEMDRLEAAGREIDERWKEQERLYGDLDTAIRALDPLDPPTDEELFGDFGTEAALEAPAQPLPSVEGVTVTPATEENSGGPTLERPWTLSSAFYDGYKCNQPIAPDHPVYMERWMAGDGERLKKLDEAVERAHAKLDEIDAQTCEPVDPHVSWEPPPPVEAEPDPIVDAGASVYGTDVAYEDGVEARLQNIPLECNPGEGVDAIAWANGWHAEDAASKRNEQSNVGGYAPVTDGDYVEHISVLTGDPAVEPESGLHGEPASVLDDPELQAAVGRAQATLVDAELDADLERVREQERARAKHHFSIFGKLEDA